MAVIEYYSHHAVNYSGQRNAYSQGYSIESSAIALNFTTAIIHFSEPITTPKSLRSKFYKHFYNWKYDTIISSSPTTIVTHPSYQQIIGMGSDVLPYIFKELSLNPDYWFWALKSITGVDPVRIEDRGNISNMQRSWLVWGKENGYI